MQQMQMQQMAMQNPQMQQQVRMLQEKIDGRKAVLISEMMDDYAKEEKKKPALFFSYSTQDNFGAGFARRNTYLKPADLSFSIDSSLIGTSFKIIYSSTKPDMVMEEGIFISSLSDEHLEKIENLKSENYSINVHYPSNPKVGYLDLEIEFTKIPEEIKLLLIASLNEDKFQTYALSSTEEPKIYKCVFDLEKSGLWNFDVSIVGPLCQEENINFQMLLVELIKTKYLIGIGKRNSDLWV